MTQVDNTHNNTQQQDEKPVDTISGATKELLEARSAGTPEDAKREKLIGAIAIGIGLIVLALFALKM